MTKTGSRDLQRLFGLDLALGVGGVLVVLVALVAAVRSVQIGASAAHQVAISGHGFTYPELNVAAAVLLGLAGFGLLVVVAAVRAAAHELRTQRGFVRSLRPCKPLAGDPDVRVVDQTVPQAFCAGYWRPCVYVSQGALKVLGPAQRHAVLTHERHHRARRDPLRLAIVRVLAHCLFFLPILRSLAGRYGALTELAADRAAVRASGGNPAPLAGAMLAFEESSGRGVDPERVDHLLGDAPHWRLPFLLLAGALGTIAVLIAVVLRAASTASAQTTLNLPLLSSQPCMLVLALLPVLVGLGALLFVRRLMATSSRPAGQVWRPQMTAGAGEASAPWEVRSDGATVSRLGAAQKP